MDKDIIKELEQKYSIEIILPTSYDDEIYINQVGEIEYLPDSDKEQIELKMLTLKDWNKILGALNHYKSQLNKR